MLTILFFTFFFCATHDLSNTIDSFPIKIGLYARKLMLFQPLPIPSFSGVDKMLTHTLTKHRSIMRSRTYDDSQTHKIN